MVYTLRSIDPKEDAAGLSQVMMGAMFQDKHWRLNFPGMPLEEIIAGCESRLRRNLITGRENKRYQKAIDLQTGEIVGYARWILPRGYEDKWLDMQIEKPTEEDAKAFEELWLNATVNGTPIGMNIAKTTEMGAVLGNVNDEIQRDGPVLELDYLTVVPSHQRRGIAGQLVRSGLEQADALRVKAYVMAKPAGIRVYEQHGFQGVKTVVQDSTKFGGSPDHVNVFMLRPVPSAAAV